MLDERVCAHGGGGPNAESLVPGVHPEVDPRAGVRSAANPRNPRHFGTIEGGTAGETVYQAGEQPETRRVSKIHYVRTKLVNYSSAKDTFRLQ